MSRYEVPYALRVYRLHSNININMHTILVAIFHKHKHCFQNICLSAEWSSQTFGPKTKSQTSGPRVQVYRLLH